MRAALQAGTKQNLQACREGTTWTHPWSVHTLPRERGRVGLRFIIVRSVPLGGAGFARGCGGAGLVIPKL